MMGVFLNPWLSAELVFVSFLAIIFWTFTISSQPDAYATFRRMGNHPYFAAYSTKPIHDHVQEGYQKVMLPFVPLFPRSLLISIDYKKGGKAICRTMVGKELFIASSKIFGRYQGCRLEKPQFFPEYQ